MSMNKKENNKTVRSRLYTSVLLVLLALVAVTAATVAWFSIADRAKVKTMSLDIVTDADLRMDLDPHSTIDQYVKTLSFEQIAARIQQEKGFSMETTPLEPVTTTDYETFTYENGTTVENTSGAYLEFTLHFMAEKDMVVHLTSANSSDTAEDGTLVSSGNSQPRIWSSTLQVPTAAPVQRMERWSCQRMQHCRNPCELLFPQTERYGITIRAWEAQAAQKVQQRHSGFRKLPQCR